MTDDLAVAQRRMESIRRHAEKTWSHMRQNLVDERQQISHPTLGSGYVITGATGPCVRLVSKETTGHDCDEKRVDMVRRFLKLSHNVVTLEKVDKFMFKIFVREQWNENTAALPMVIADTHERNTSNDWYARRLTPEEAGETMAPQPVVTQYVCNQCGQAFDTKQGLGGHVSSIHSIEGKTFPCPECDMVFNSPRVRGSHIKDTHRDRPKPRQRNRGALADALKEDGRYHCPECDVSYEKMNSLTSHMQRHKNMERKRPKNQEITCQECGRVFGSPFALGGHMQTHTKGNIGEYPCPDCEYVATSSAGLAGHSKIHKNKQRQEQPVAARPGSIIRLPDDLDAILAKLLEEVKTLRQRAAASGDVEKLKSEVDAQSAKLALIADLVQAVSDGKMRPLKAVSEIEEALSL